MLSGYLYLMPCYPTGRGNMHTTQPNGRSPEQKVSIFWVHMHWRIPRTSTYPRHKQQTSVSIHPHRKKSAANMLNSQLFLATLNIQELDGNMVGLRKRWEFKEFFPCFTPKPDISLIQKHKVPLKDCRKQLKQMDYLKGEAYWNEELYSAPTDGFKTITCIFISPNLSPTILQHSIIVLGRA